jgi:putative amino-acid transport system ATP-binding protein
MTQPLIVTEHLYKDFGDTKVLKDVNLQIYKNQVAAIMGPSGTGKSTLLRCLNYLTIPTSGVVIIGDIRIDAKTHTKQDILDLRKQS